MQVETMLEEHTGLCHSLYESLAQGSVTDEMENEATHKIERAAHIVLKIVKDAHIQDLDRVRKLLTRFTAHCETWDVVNDQDISPANDIFKIFKGDLIAINKIYEICCLKRCTVKILMRSSIMIAIQAKKLISLQVGLEEK